MTGSGRQLDGVLNDAATRLEVRHVEDLEWHAFPETWASTSLGFGRPGGQMMTTAQTYVVMYDNAALLYWGGAFAKPLSRARAQEFAAARRSR